MLGVRGVRGPMAFVGFGMLGASWWGFAGLLGEFETDSDRGTEAGPEGASSAEGSVDSPAPVLDAAPEAAAARDGGGDAPIDAPIGAPDAPVDAPPPIRELYLITATGFMPPVQNDLDVIDLAKGAAVTDVSMNGAVAVAYANGNVYVARGSGQSRVTILTPGVLNHVQDVILPLDPTAAVFRPDCSSVFIATTAGELVEISLPSGTAVWLPITVPLPPTLGSSPQLTGLALDATLTHMGVTEFSGSQSSVAIVNKNTNGTWAVGLNVASPAVAGSNCGREAMAPSFSPDGTVLSTFDPNCSTYDVYTVATGARNTTASAQFTRTSGVSFSQGSVWDSKGQVWSTNYMDAYRTSEEGMPTSFPLPNGTSPGTLALDDTRSTLYFFPYDPRTNGAYTLDLVSGTGTALNWALSLIPGGANIASATYVVR